MPAVTTTEPAEPPGVADIVAVVISPILLIGLIASLVFFLVEVTYQGGYASRLLWTLFFFVVGAVLIARVAIQVDAGRASGYAIALGLAGYLAMMIYVQFPPNSPMAKYSWLINAGLLILIWWSASKLTWDCTHVDDSRDASDQGLLLASGLEQDQPIEEEMPVAQSQTWWQRFQAYRERQAKKPHTPGVWVVYFSIAAFPLFGLLGSLIRPDEMARRERAFYCLVVYVGCALGLLLTTAFLGLRRYLRQREVTMPPQLTGVWLGIGAGLIAVLLILGAFLPRPWSETPLLAFSGITSPERKAARWTPLRDAGTSGSGTAGRRVSREATSDGQKSDSQAEGQSGKKSADDTQGKSKSNSQGKSDSPNPMSGDQSSNTQDDGGDARTSGQEGNKKRSDAPKVNTPESGEGMMDEPPGRREELEDFVKRELEDGTSRSPSFSEMTEQVTENARWVIFWVMLGLMALVALYLLLRYLANFTVWARAFLDAIWNIWRSLFGTRRAEDESEDRLANPVIVREPFANYPNPFSDGVNRTPAELIHYSFAALDAWAWDRSIGRNEEETPLEFARRLAESHPALEGEFRVVANLMSRLAYAPGPLPSGVPDVLRQFWERIEA